MARRLLRAASMIILVAAVSAGCSGGDETTSANVVGRWKGTLALAFVGTTPTTSGAITVDLSQEDNFASGIAEWDPADAVQGITGPIDVNAFTFLLHFRCPSKNGGVTLTGTVTDNLMTITGGSGIACFGRIAPDVTVAGAVGSLTRDPNDQPL